MCFLPVPSEPGTGVAHADGQSNIMTECTNSVELLERALLPLQVGPAGVGKSQLCHMLAVSALLPQVQHQQADIQANSCRATLCTCMTCCLTHHVACCLACLWVVRMLFL